MTAFITHCWKNRGLERLTWLLGWVLLLCCLGSGGARAEAAVEVQGLRLERSGDDLLLSAGLKFELPQPVEEALLKGVAVFFVAEADLLRERWYWVDKRLASVQRHMRLVFQPLTRRWRLAVGAGPITANGQGVALNQNFDTLPEALAAVQRISCWRIAEQTELESGVRYRLEFRYRLDVTQLPRPLQIGALGQSDWTLGASVSQRFDAESLK